MFRLKASQNVRAIKSIAILLAFWASSFSLCRFLPKIPIKNIDDHKSSEGPDYDALSAENAKQALIVNRRALQTSLNALATSGRQFWSTTITSIVLILISAVLCYFTKQLSDETSGLETSNINQVRAYLDIASVVTRVDSVGKISATLTFRNSGQTPARSVFFSDIALLTVFDKLNNYNTYGWFSSECKPTIDTRFEQVGPADDRNILFNGVYLPLDRSGRDKNSKLSYFDIVPATDIADFRAGKSTLVVAGVVCYKDAFQNQHYARFCRSYDLSNISIGKDAVFGLCNDNDSD